MTDLGFLDSTRTSYDAVAASYSALTADQLPGEPVLRSMLRLFAELTHGRTADVGCGPGHVTGFLHGQGLDVFGIDLSPGMVEQARTNYPELHFELGSMTGLDYPDGSLAGLNAWFSTIHIPDRELPGVLAEFHRVLTPGGPLMLAFQVGDGPEAFAGHPRYITRGTFSSGMNAHAPIRLAHGHAAGRAADRARWPPASTAHLVAGPRR